MRRVEREGQGESRGRVEKESREKESREGGGSAEKGLRMRGPMSGEQEGGIGGRPQEDRRAVGEQGRRRHGAQFGWLFAASRGCFFR